MTSSIAAERTRAGGWLAIGTQLLAITVVVLGLMNLRAPPSERVAGSVLLLGAIALFAGAAYLHARRAVGPRRLVFLWMAISSVFSTVAQAHNTFRYVIPGIEPVFPSPGLLVFLLGTHPALLIAFGSAIVWRRVNLRTDAVMDVLLLAIAAGVVGFQIVSVVPWPIGGFSDPARVLLLLWRVLPVAELCLVIALVVTRGDMLGWRTSTALVLAMLVFAAGNVLHGQLALVDQAAAVTATDVIWALNLICLTASLGGLPGRTTPSSPTASSSIVSHTDSALRARFVIVGLVICAQATLMLGFRVGRNPPLAAAIALFSLLLAARSAREMLRARRYASTLAGDIVAERAVSHALETRVAERTAELADAERVLQRMWVLGQHVTQELESPLVVQRFMEAVMDVAQVDAAALGLVADERNLRLAAVLGAGTHLTGMLLPIDGSVMGRVVRDGRSWHVSDVDDAAEVLYAPLLSALHAQPDGAMGGGLAVVPVQRRGERIGALALVSHQARTWTADELARIEAMTDLLSVALANAEAVESLRQAEWRFRTLFRSAPDAVITLLHGGRIQEANDYAADLFSEQPAALAGRMLEDFVVPADREALRRALAAGFRGQPTRVDVHVPRPAGARRMEIALRQLPEADPAVVLLIGRDVTTEVEMQARLVETERLAAVGELVAGVAHEVNNPLGSISAFAQLLLREEGLTADQRESLEIIYGETLRASHVVKDLLAFARRSAPRRESVDLAQVVERALRLRGYQLASHGVSTVLQLPPGLPSVVGDARQLQQVVLNLVTNALQAMPDGGDLRLTASAGDNMVALEITDSGTGIPESVRPHIFEPFFTTKPEGEGTGLGLSVSYGIVAAHGGTLALADSSPSGTTFLISLPPESAVDAAIEADAETVRTVVRSPLQGLRLLFVDDEASLRHGMEAFGRLRGIFVVTAPDGQRALDVLERASFDAVVCDLRMPAMDGMAFYEALSVRRPGLAARTVFVTGDMIGGTMNWGRNTRPITLTKPFTFDQLEDAVWAVLRGVPVTMIR
ncbi:MAG: hybrid sensor histidine kinase/response regulator [Gemmatimonadaceae bacterium]